MEKQYSVKFFSSFVDNLQKLCQTLLDFDQIVEVSGYVCVEIDNSKKERYVLSEMVQNCGNVISESYCTKVFRTLARTRNGTNKADDTGTTTNSAQTIQAGVRQGSPYTGTKQDDKDKEKEMAGKLSDNGKVLSDHEGKDSLTSIESSESTLQEDSCEQSVFSVQSGFDSNVGHSVSDNKKCGSDEKKQSSSTQTERAIEINMDSSDGSVTSLSWLPKRNFPPLSSNQISARADEYLKSNAPNIKPSHNNFITSDTGTCNVLTPAHQSSPVKTQSTIDDSFEIIQVKEEREEYVDIFQNPQPSKFSVFSVLKDEYFSDQMDGDLTKLSPTVLSTKRKSTTPDPHTVIDSDLLLIPTCSSAPTAQTRKLARTAIDETSLSMPRTSGSDLMISGTSFLTSSSLSSHVYPTDLIVANISQNYLSTSSGMATNPFSVKAARIDSEMRHPENSEPLGMVNGCQYCGDLFRDRQERDDHELVCERSLVGQTKYRFYCQACQWGTNKLFNWQRHLASYKHTPRPEKKTFQGKKGTLKDV